MKSASTSSTVTPFEEISREDWARLSRQTPLPLSEEDVTRLRGLGDRVDLREVDAVYRPISRLLNIQVAAAQALRRSREDFLDQHQHRTPYIIGVAGSVAVGKSTTARLLRELMARWPETPRVQLVTTDGFLHSNAVLESRGIMHRKGFPESYDRRRLLRFVADVKAGQEQVEAPVYSHLTYDILEDERVVVQQPDVLIVEGLNVLQPARPRRDGRLGMAVSDFFDFSVYVDARVEDVQRWYVERFLKLRRTAFSDPRSYFRRYADLTDEEAVETAQGIWQRINGPNLTENVVPTRGRADLVLRKDGQHRVHSVLLRKV
ncbi:Pantothenate kinase [Brachybacterium faecium]|uniref:Pantothenate kinase n=1 Tax=Brachybacterium faecium (strain ATCC 43885 / DSM 4810 / JCM 11609 / LMG 19847 / NBRC 14762 / NCIMB 9860 / 6-10) TaxID=446465 RepID=C7MEW3_BRAFD|nr:type I pantothenate kinase [Brachybacterium faecium]ACU86113.1 pantothenate kinase [Brachybacterium faecium DSM 4810]SLM94987.1 Pantothenate kinase [Brachybacterium faecium]HJG50581.1 type I pantothenate kinase [Brachybacterium faecium]